MQPSSNLVSPRTAASVPTPTPPRHDRWLRRADLLLRVMLQMYLGLLLVFAPWTRFWTYNHLLLYFAPIAHLTATGAVRGLVSGLGLLNLWIALFDAIHYKES
ncbi:MAG: hypothetical protein WCA44_11735 [Acidobacteriaceae bacterium]